MVNKPDALCDAIRDVSENHFRDSFDFEWIRVILDGQILIVPVRIDGAIAIMLGPNRKKGSN